MPFFPFHSYIPTLKLSRVGCICGLILALLPFLALSQKSKPNGQFLTDSIEIGKPFLYSLSYHHNPQKEVFFPDSTFDFSPFEVISQKNFPSSTNPAVNITLDSAIYQLVSYNVTPSQVLTVPIYLFGKKDCTAVFTIPDTIFLKRNNLTPIIKKEALKSETGLVPLRNEFNFSRFLGYFGLALTFIIGIYWVFGKDILKQWQLIKLQRRHLEYLRSFNRLLRNAREKNNIKDAESAIIVWKNYLERLERKPFATYTTREIMDNLPDENLAEALKSMDGIIYGQVKSNNIDVFLEVLKTGATRLYRAKRRQILDNPVA